MRLRPGIFLCCGLLVGLLMTACGAQTIVVSPATNTPTASATPSATPSSTTSPGSSSPPSSANPTPTIAVYGDLTGIWQGDDKSYYYVRQVGNTVTWAGFSPDDGVSFTNVLCATRSGNGISGNWADVSRGNTAGNGTLSLQIDASNPNDIQIHKTIANTFGASTWHKLNNGPSLPAMVPSLRSSNANPSDLSGTWGSSQPNDGSYYYVRQIGNNVWWLGVSGDDGQSFTNVFCGHRSGDTFTGAWSDIPRGASHSSGTLSLSFYHQGGFDRFQALSASGGFGTSQWTRFTL